MKKYSWCTLANGNVTIDATCGGGSTKQPLGLAIERVGDDEQVFIEAIADHPFEVLLMVDGAKVATIPVG